MSDEPDNKDKIFERLDEIDLKYAEMQKALKAENEAIEDIKKWIRDQLVPQLNSYAKVINTVSEMIKKAQGQGGEVSEGGETPEQQMQVELETKRKIDEARRDLVANGGDPNSPFMQILFKIADGVMGNMFAPKPTNAQIFSSSILPEMERQMMEQYIEGMKTNNLLGAAIADAVKKKGLKAIGENAASSLFEGVLSE